MHHFVRMSLLSKCGQGRAVTCDIHHADVKLINLKIARLSVAALLSELDAITQSAYILSSNASTACPLQLVHPTSWYIQPKYYNALHAMCTPHTSQSDMELEVPQGHDMEKVVHLGPLLLTHVV